MLGRIRFPGNPWPDGHLLKTLVWSGRLDMERGLMFDLHLESENYYAEGEGIEPKGRHKDSDWKSPVVWRNYHSCTLSSTKWHEGGFLAASPSEPLKWRKLGRRIFEVDALPLPDTWDLEEDAGFHVYLLGHDAVADHRIRIAPQRGSNLYMMRWLGRVALVYAGDDELRYQFEVAAENLRFSGLSVPAGTSKEEGREFAEACVPDVTFRAQSAGKRGTVLFPVKA